MPCRNLRTRMSFSVTAITPFIITGIPSAIARTACLPSSSRWRRTAGKPTSTWITAPPGFLWRCLTATLLQIIRMCGPVGTHRSICNGDKDCKGDGRLEDAAGDFLEAWLVEQKPALSAAYLSRRSFGCLEEY